MQQFITFLVALAAYASQLIDPFSCQGAYEVQLFLDADEAWYRAGGLAIVSGDPLPVLMVDDIVHDAEHLRCSDFTCPCWDEYHDQEADFERRYVEIGMTERYDTLPWRGCADYSSYY
jgi:hypothetical protein